jgi:hypothetical protein
MNEEDRWGSAAEVLVVAWAEAPEAGGVGEQVVGVDAGEEPAEVLELAEARVVAEERVGAAADREWGFFAPRC